ncbi:ATP-grasp domain-containing protein [Streptomyces sp. NPDC051133]|uniref:ATP-grasp domain-containing protein n=1 Tax=Streptomyces sp. NPDC051133 TaxID=3155521 RepID=UPI0034497CCC
MSKVLYVHAKGGPPVGHALPRAAARSAVHLLAISELPATAVAEASNLCASVITPQDAYERDLAEIITARAREVGADAVITFSAYAVAAVAEAARRLGLMGAGRTAPLARDKRLMRAAWQRHGIPQPRFRAITSADELEAAAAELSYPLLLGHAELHVTDSCEDFIVEEIVSGCTREWFTDPGCGDYISVEGVVVDAAFHPVCVSGRMPTVALFTERAGITTAALESEAQNQIVELARRAVDALGLENCGTHTEIKLGMDGRIWVIETAARFGGAMTVPQIEQVFGLDLVGMFTDQLLGRSPLWPARALTAAEADGAAGSLVVLAVDGDGVPWPRRHQSDSKAVIRCARIGADAELSVVSESSLTEGSPVPVYAPAAGANTIAGLCLLSADRPQTVIGIFSTLINTLPHILPADVTEGVPA